MTTTLHGISAAADATARKIDRDEVLVMTVHRSEVYLLAGDGQWTGTGRRNVSDVIRDCERTGDGFARYYVVESDGSYSEAE